ncbi:MAG TPA: hypothetical protein VFU74_23410 [Actinocrinis sp.]|nr:hypothetical protein [Actinocrinis sp.]
MHDPEETMGPRDATTGEAMDPEALDAPGRIDPDDTSAIPSDTQAEPGVVRHQASDQSDAPIPDVMGEPVQPTSDVMGAPVPQADATLGDRNEADRL